MKERNNYFSFQAIYTALSSTHSAHLRLAWKRVSDEIMLEWKEWREIFKRDHDNRNFRERMRSLKDSRCIPWYGLILRDLKEMNMANVGDNSDEINMGHDFTKYTRFTHKIQQITRYQQFDDESIKPQERIQKVLLMLLKESQNVTEEDIFQMTSKVIKNDQTESKMHQRL